MSYCNLTANAHAASKVQAPKQPVLDDFERDIKANIEAIQSCARAATARQMDSSRSGSPPGQPSNTVSGAQHLSSGHALAAATERLFRDWAVQWAGEPAERCRKRCAHDRLRKALAGAVANLGEAARLTEASQPETEEAASKEDLAALDGDEEQASLLGSWHNDSETDAAQHRQCSLRLPLWFRDAVIKCRSWRESSASAFTGDLSMKSRSLNLIDSDLPALAGRLLVLQEATYKFLAVAAILLVLATVGSRTFVFPRHASASVAQGAASAEYLALPGGNIAAWLDGKSASLPILQEDSDGNSTSFHEPKPASRVSDLTAVNADITTAQQSIASMVNHKSWGAVQV